MPLYRYPDAAGIARPLTGELAPGAAVATGVPSECQVQLAGLGRFRIYFESTAAGSLALLYLKAGSRTATLTVDNPTPVAIVANTENSLEVDPHFGEWAAVVRFTPSGNGAVTTAEICGVAPAAR